jgi:FAD/FMN-containing dehydrogenase
VAKLDAVALDELKASTRGEVLLPDDGNYDEARTIWNTMIDRKPAVIVRCVGAHDVIQAVNLARGSGALLSVKGGGHNVAGNAVCDGGIVIDLSLMRSAHVDTNSKTARADGGCLLGDVDAATQLHGLAVSAGIVSHTGVAGLTLGGGFGWISRKHGYTIDNLISVDIVTADGELVKASAKENPDLFWAIRGGGGNFGIATSFEYQCAEIGTEVYSGLIVHPFENAKEYMTFYRDYVRTLPDEMTVWMVARHAPPLPFLPEDVHGRLIVAVPFLYLGDPAKGEELIKPIREFGQPHGEHIGMNPFAGWQTTFDVLNSHGARNYWKSHHLKDLSDACIDQVIEYAGNLPTPHCEIFIAHMEGAPSRVPENETAFGFRDAPFVINVHTRWTDRGDDERCIAWAREFFESTKPFAKGVYVNFLSDEGEDRVRDAYPVQVWNRLVELKKKYDPTNLFRMNQNIKPAA